MIVSLSSNPNTVRNEGLADLYKTSLLSPTDILLIIDYIDTESIQLNFIP
jgi:hypothetical protein